MKVNIEIDCSPEEARRFMGLPDVEKANAAYVDAMTSAMKGAPDVEQMQDYARKLAPMGQFGLKLFQDFMQGAAEQAGSMSATDKARSQPKGGKSGS